MREWKNFETSLINNGVTKRRIKNLITYIRTIERGVGKEIEDCTRKDFEIYIRKLHTNEFLQKNGKTPYAGESKQEHKKIIRQFFKWYKGNDEIFPPEVAWIRTKVPKDEQAEEKQVVSIEQLNKIVKRMSKIEPKVMTRILFDAGFRIGELLSCKKKDLTWEAFGENSCFWIKCNDSKTLTRKVPIPLFTEEIRTFFTSYEYESKSPNDFLFTMKDVTYRRILRYASEKVLNKDVKKGEKMIYLTPHCLRHSSATYYSMELDGNMNAIAQRYGWEYDSQQLKTYIRKSGVYQKQSAKKVFTNELLKLKIENKQLKESVDIIFKEHSKLKTKIEDIIKHLDKKPKR